MTDKENRPPSPGQPAYRSGVAARLAGLSAETLRVWERRYGVSDTARSPRGQRLYSPEQVERLRVLKGLVDQGHPIGLIAGLPLQQLAELNQRQARPAGPSSHPVRIALIGPTLAARLAASGRDSLSLDVRFSAARLDLPTLPAADIDVLVAEISELDEATIPLIAQARQATGAPAVVVLYRFSPSAVIRQLRRQDCTVARIPADLGELALLCRTALGGQRSAPADAESEEPAAVRFDEQALATLATASNKIGCECPRHLAELLLMVGSFERYSAQCASRNEDDAMLHQELGRAAGQARELLEKAMERLVQAEGLKY